MFRSDISEQELLRQKEFCRLNRDLLIDRFGHPPVACTHMFGCQQNVSDGERMEGMLETMGFSFTDDPMQADLVLYNTCAVREHAELRALGHVGNLKAWKTLDPNRIIALCGCMVQQQQVTEKIKRSYPYVNLVFGTHVVHKLPENLHRLLTGEKRVFDIHETDGVIVEGLPTRRTGVKGWLPVMYGCNNFCTYCIVPYVRGRERSRCPQAIVEEAQQMVAAGYKEITLLGQNVNSYGKDLETPVSFAKLLRMINEIPGDFIIRFMTSHPKDCTLELLEAMRDCKKVAKHLHLPVQSGSDRILKLMNRKYDRQRYLSVAAKAKELMPELCLTTDIIVGFPGETHDDFLQTVDLARQVEYSAAYTFIFSPREGTPAARMEDTIPAEEKTAWLQEFSAMQEAVALNNSAAYVGKSVRVLCEGEKKDGIYTGRTEGNILVEFPGTPDLVNTFVTVTVNEALSFVLKGTVE